MREGSCPWSARLKPSPSFHPPQKAKSLLGFLGAVNYYRRCLPNLDGRSPAAVLQPLYTAATLKQPGKAFKTIWQEMKLDGPFNDAKKLLVMACKLTHPDPEAPLALVSDASKEAAAASLEQLTNGVW